MPALVLFGRKWLISCDDLVIPFVIEAFFRISWLTGTLALRYLKLNCYSSLYVRSFFYTAFIDLLISSCLSIAISFTSSRGAILEVQKRKSLNGLLYAKFFVLFVDTGLAVFGTWLLIVENNICSPVQTFVQVTTVFLWLYILIVLLSVYICYNSLGSSKFWNMKASSTSLRFFQKAERIWRLRLKFFCCCADIGEDNDFVYVEISSFLASFLNEIDLVPTDILAGIVSLSAKHAVERRKKNSAAHLEHSSELWNDARPSWMTTVNALYFLKIAKSTYGWLAFFNIFQPWILCKLISPSRCCLRSFNSENNTVDNCCYCNTSAIKKITGYSESNILYSSFQNSIYEPAFYIVIDHAKKAVIIAIRGTMSFSDLVTDIDAEVESFPSINSSNKFKCHRGCLRSALYLYKRINELHILEVALSENPTYATVITGHSLGGSIAAILGLLLHPKIPDLQCYVFAPVAAVSAKGIRETLDFVFTIVIGDDAVPSLSAESCKRLRTELIKALEETKVPKYKILTRACWYHIKKRFTKPKKRVLTEIYENMPAEESGTEETIPPLETNRIYDPMNCKLFAPGRILYFEKRNGCQFEWVTGSHFQQMRISKTMFSDHQPRRIQSKLEEALKLETL